MCARCSEPTMHWNSKGLGVRMRQAELLSREREEATGAAESPALVLCSSAPPHDPRMKHHAHGLPTRAQDVIQSIMDFCQLKQAQPDASPRVMKPSFKANIMQQPRCVGRLVSIKPLCKSLHASLHL